MGDKADMEALEEERRLAAEMADEQNDDAAARREAMDAIKRFTDEDSDADDEDDLGNISVKSILGGDILQSRFFLKQVLFIFFVVLLMLVYTGNRYASQHDIIAIDSLKVQLQQDRYNVLTQLSELLNLSRQSNVEQRLRQLGDSTLLNPGSPPYEISAGRDE